MDSAVVPTSSSEPQSLPTQKKKKRCRGGKNLRRHVLRLAAERPEGVSRNSLKTGQKHGRKSVEAKKREREARKIKVAARRKAQKEAESQNLEGHAVTAPA